MARYVTVGAAQFGPVQRREKRGEVVDRLQEEIDAYFERDMPGPNTRRLFDEARPL